MKRLSVLLTALAATPGLTGCCCWDWCCNPCRPACSPCGSPMGAYASPYGVPAVGAVSAPVSTTALYGAPVTTAYMPLESLPTY